MKCKHCGSEIENKTIKIKELNIEVETEYSQKDIKIKDIKIPNGWRLLTLPEWLELYNNHQKKFKDLNKDSDEIVQQPIESVKDKYPYWNVWWYDLDDGSVPGNRSLYYDDGVRGVRFCRDLKKKSKEVEK